MPEKEQLIVGTLYCCECNLCSMMACPEDLDPKNVCVFDKQQVREMGLKWPGNGRRVHPLMEARRVPLARIINKLGLRQFRNVGPLIDQFPRVKRVVLPLRQHLGAACKPAVRVGQKVREGDLIGKVPGGALGAPIHASIDGVVAEVGEAVVIEAR